MSFGEAGVLLDLRNLNVLVGPNGGGKSNLMAVLGLLNSLDGNLNNIWEAKEWLWRSSVNGESRRAKAPAKLEKTTKSKYDQKKHAPEILQRFCCAKVRKAAPNCDRFFKTLLASGSSSPIVESELLSELEIAPGRDDGWTN